MNIVMGPSCWHQNFGPKGLSAPSQGLCLNFFSSITADFKISSALRWAIQDQWSSGFWRYWAETKILRRTDRRPDGQPQNGISLPPPPPMRGVYTIVCPEVHSTIWAPSVLVLLIQVDITTTHIRLGGCPGWSIIIIIRSDASERSYCCQLNTHRSSIFIPVHEIRIHCILNNFNRILDGSCGRTSHP